MCQPNHMQAICGNDMSMQLRRLTLKIFDMRESKQAQSVLALTSTEPR